MLQLFSVEQDTSNQPDAELEDARTSFREVQGQDVVRFANTVYEDNFRRVMSDPNDKEALAWILSDSRERLSFLHCCDIFNLDPDKVRAAIPTRNKP